MTDEAIPDEEIHRIAVEFITHHAIFLHASAHGRPCPDDDDITARIVAEVLAVRLPGYQGNTLALIRQAVAREYPW